MANTTGKKYGGRQKGTPNKTSLTWQQLIDDYKVDPIQNYIKVLKAVESKIMFTKLKNGVMDKETIELLKIYLMANDKLAAKSIPDRKSIDIESEINFPEPPIINVIGNENYEHWKNKVKKEIDKEKE